MLPLNEKAQLILQAQKDVLNGGVVLTPASVVTQIKTQLNNEINIAKGLTGTAIIPINSNSHDNEKIRTRRNNQRARQKTYRHNHRRLQVWVASNLTAITATYEAKIVVIIAARLPKVPNGTTPRKKSS